MLLIKKKKLKKLANSCGIRWIKHTRVFLVGKITLSFIIFLFMHAPFVTDQLYQL